KLTVHGKLGHVAYPHLAENPIHRAAGWIAELSARQWDQGTEHFLPTSFQISNINAGVGAVNVIPSELTMLFNIRFNTNWSHDTLIAEIESLADKYDLKADFEWKRSANPFVTTPGAMTEALKAAIVARTGVTANLNTAGGTSDARFISRISRETVEFGPMNATIHSINECVGIDELEALTDIYTQVIANLLTETRGN
ncbi:MAG: M20/M25/M40 family metallo-hydrolase, partial [Sutterellaceae bacterium]|nr:M20/M25/M40 family metallo-hydrolase [Sutterellaceae bacterium]